MVDIYRDAKRRGIYLSRFPDPEGHLPNQTDKKTVASVMATISSFETFVKRRAIFLSVRKTVNIQG